MAFQSPQPHRDMSLIYPVSHHSGAQPDSYVVSHGSRVNKIKHTWPSGVLSIAMEGDFHWGHCADLTLSQSVFQNCLWFSQLLPPSRHHQLHIWLSPQKPSCSWPETPVSIVISTRYPYFKAILGFMGPKSRAAAGTACCPASISACCSNLQLNLAYFHVVLSIGLNKTPKWGNIVSNPNNQIRNWAPILVVGAGG